MTKAGPRKVFVIALVVSLVAHVALMFWVRPQVMTHVLSCFRKAKHIELTVRDAPAIATPKDIARIMDEDAKKGAPSAEASGLAPASAEVLPMTVEKHEVVMPQAPTVPVELKSAVVAPVAAPAAEKMITESLKPAAAPVATSPSIMTFAGSDLVVTVPPVTVDLGPAPVIGPEGFSTVGASGFVVSGEVLSQVDEKFIESEKRAVRALINASGAADITRAVNVRLEKSAAGGWTYFRITLTPKDGLLSVPKDVVVLIDASGSIGYDRLASCRKAAKQLLRTCTNTGDRFNLVAFRDRYSYAFRSWQECSAASFESADRWLTALAAHGRTDVFASIRSVLTLPRDPKRPLIAMVVTDGDANMGVSETKEILSKFSNLNDGLISVYMYGVRKSANRELIDVLTHGNRGESLVYDSWKPWSAGEGIEGLAERFRDPLITDLRLVFTAGMKADAYPTVLKNLYRGNTVTVTGRVPGAPKTLDFELKGLAGDRAFAGFFRLPLDSAATAPQLAGAFATEAALSAQTH